MTELEKTPNGDGSGYEQLKRQIYHMLEGPNPLLVQSFDKVEKKIMLRANI